jgi:8-oxo-dGTP pyrophosphatase MutT (NUDIX family)
MAYTPMFEKKQKYPITSYGIILFYIDVNNTIWYLLGQRRDTIEYSTYLRGNYSELVVEKYIRLMTITERNRLLNNSFDDLWDDLWVNHTNTFYKLLKPKAKIKYYTNFLKLKTIIENTESVIKEPRWEFPKGKKNKNENEIDCAFREFKEETKINIDYLNLLNLAPIKETFKGSDDKIYSTVYYIAQIDKKVPIRKTLILNRIRKETISEEISNLKWCTIDQAINLIPSCRKDILFEAQFKILNYLKN